MLDFLLISTRVSKSGAIEIYPKFIVKKSKDLMIRGGDFYAIWIEEKGLWSTEEQDARDLIDRELDRFAKEKGNALNGNFRVLHLWDAENGMIDRWNKYCQSQMRDNFVILDEKVIFANTPVEKTDYASKRLPYSMEKGETPAYDHLMSVIYDKEERLKIEWAIGAIICGDSKVLQKFLVFYGAPGTGKSTVLNIIQKLFDGYYSAFDAKTLGSSSSSFALEAFRSNPLIAIQHDGDLSRIEDNTRLNSIVSHEGMSVNVKFRSAYSAKFQTFLFLGTNKPVKITDSKSGLLRRLIDVSPTGEKLSGADYKRTIKKIDYELGSIAYHCKEVYEGHKHDFDDYIPMSMLGASNDFFNFMLESYGVFSREDGTTLKSAWEMYKVYCDEAKVPYPYSQRVFKEELKNYFREFDDRYMTRDDGQRSRNYYRGFKKEMFEVPENEEKATVKETGWIIFEENNESALDRTYAEFLAQYATDDENEKPIRPWVEVVTFLQDIDTSKVHFLKPPENLIVIDFDIRDENGEKSLEKSIEEANKFPPTYAEVSKSGNGIHLHYIYTGDVTKLASVYKKHIEIKTFTGGAALRRKLTKCNTLEIATISSGLPLRKEKMVNLDAVKDQRELIRMIKKNLQKWYHDDTSSSINYINKLLNDAYESGMSYDVSNLYNAVFAFAAQSTNQADRCMKLVDQMHFKSKEEAKEVSGDDKPIMIFDLEVKPNMNFFGGKELGEDKVPLRIFNPTPSDVENFITNFRLIGFNNLNYDNHILYAMMLGKTPAEVFDVSNRIINKDNTAKFYDSKPFSYTDIYDFITKKQSLKKYEIELGLPHLEFNHPWDQPIPECMWNELADYCINDVLATEAVFLTKEAQSDFAARCALADVAGLTPNDTTNTLTTRIIFGTNRYPQSQFNYRNMGDVSLIDHSIKTNLAKLPEYTVFTKDGKPIFPGYEYKAGVSTYRGEEVGEGGYVYGEYFCKEKPNSCGIYKNVALLDIASMHPSSIIAENLFGDTYTKRFKDIVDARIAVKHKDFEKARTMLDGALTRHLEDESKSGDLAQALKIAINSVYGLTAASFDNPFRDRRNRDNIVAKRGALFMVNLKHEVQARGFTVAHIKTDSIKIPDATPEIIKFVTDYGKLYGYNFEHEATYDRMCLVNDAVYIAKYASKETCEELYGYIPDKNEKHPNEWTATGTQFQVPYIFKTLFSKEPIIFKDLCETKSVSKGTIYVDMNEDLPDVSSLEKDLTKLEAKFKKGLIGDEEFVKAAEDLNTDIALGHNYIFVGRVGSFCPIKEGCGGGVLYRKSDEGKYFAVTGTKSFRWLESEIVKNLGKEDDINEDYYIQLVDEAKDAINKQGESKQITFEDFVYGDLMQLDINPPKLKSPEEEVPF